MHHWVGFIGLIGLLGLIGLKNKVPAGTPGAAIRLLALFGFIGLGGFWHPPLGACGAFGVLGLWGHPQQEIARLSWLGCLGLIGPVIWLTHHM